MSGNLKHEFPPRQTSLEIISLHFNKEMVMVEVEKVLMLQCSMKNT